MSYYDYYQPEAYVPPTDTYIEKDSSINEEIDKLRLSATNALFEREDVLIVASVSCIYGLGSPEAYYGMLVYLEEGDEIDRRALFDKLIQCQYERNETDFYRGRFRVRGETVDVYPAYEEDKAYRIVLDRDRVAGLYVIDPLSGKPREKLNRVTIYPATHYVTPKEKVETAISEHTGGTRRTAERAAGDEQTVGSAEA